MVTTGKDPVLAVVALAGGNDMMNNVIPYTDPHYRDLRPRLGIPEDQIVPFTDALGFHPSFAPMKKYWDEGNLAIILGAGHPNPSMSHFRSLDIWATCDPYDMANDGWLGRTIQALDPKAENVLTGVNFGRGLPRAMAKEAVPVASVGDLAKYGLLTEFKREHERSEALDIFGRMYAPLIGTGQVDSIIRRTGIDAMTGAEVLVTAPGKYQSDVEYMYGNIGEYLRDMVQVHNAGFGTQVMYTSSPYNLWDHHAGQLIGQSSLLENTANNVDAFFTDLRQHSISDNVVMMIYSEFGRRAKDNGTGTDHGAGGVTFIVGEPVKGGIYGEYPSMKLEDLDENGNLKHNVDFRSAYTTLLERWLGVDAKPIVGGSFEHLDFL